MNNNYLQPEDYIEPNCPLCNIHEENRKNNSVPIDRIINKLDLLLNERDYTNAKKHLLYWYNEALQCNDKRGEFTLAGELMGFYRKQGDGVEALKYAKRSLELIEELNIGDTVSAGTALVNVATVYKSQNMINEALPLFFKALNNYKSNLSPTDTRLGSLYNNMGTALTEANRLNEAIECYRSAIHVMSKNANTELEQAITYINEINVFEKLNDDKNIKNCLNNAKILFNAPNVKQDAYYAYVATNCKSCFAYFGDKEFEKDLEKRIKSVYERN